MSLLPEISCEVEYSPSLPKGLAMGECKLVGGEWVQTRITMPVPPSNTTTCGWCGYTWPVDDSDDCVRCTAFWAAALRLAIGVGLIWLFMWSATL